MNFWEGKKTKKQWYCQHEFGKKTTTKNKGIANTNFK